MADGQPAGSGPEESSAAGSSSALLQSDQQSPQSLEAGFPSTVRGHSDLQRSRDSQDWLMTPSADPGSGQVTEIDQRQVTQPYGPLSERGLAYLAGDCQLEANTGHVTIQAPGTSGVVKGVEQNVYKGPVQHNHYHFHGAPPPRAAFDTWRQGRTPQLPESSAQSALPPPASPPAGPRLALPETPPPPKKPRRSSEPAQPQAPAAVPQLPATQPAAVAAVTSPEPRGDSQAAYQSNPAAEPQGGRPAVDEPASLQSSSSSSSSLASSQRPQSRTEADAASREQGRAWAAGQRPDPVTLPEESQQLKNLIANTRQLVATHAPQGYVDTAALDEMLEGLQQQGVCLVLGLPGHGKTALALQAMGRLAASHHLKPLRLDSPNQWRWIPGETELDTTHAQQQQQQRRSLVTGERDPRNCSEDVSLNSRRYTVLIDDVFGKGNYNEARSESWGELFDLMLAKVRAGQVKLILVSRAHVLQACQVGLSEHSLFSEARTIDLRKPQYWTEEDNEDILEHFLSQHDVQIATPLQDFVEATATCTEIGFPQCCQYFATNTDAQKEACKFFQHPVSFLQRQLKSLQEKDPRSYLVLVLTWLGGDCLSEEETAADHAKLKAICRQFGVKEELTWTEIEATARNLCGVYLQEVEEGVFKLTHHSLHDCLVVAVCKADLKRALKVCSLQQVCEYMHTKGSSGGHAGLTYTVRRSQWPPLAARLVKAMTSEERDQALRHPSLRDKDFVSELVTKYMEPSQRRHLLKMKVQVGHWPVRMSTFLAAVIRLGYSDLSKCLLAAREMIELAEEESRTFLREALESACSVGDNTMVRHLLDRKAQVTEDTLLAAGKCPKDDVTTLRALHHPRPLDPVHSEYRDLLFECCLRGKLQCVLYLLRETRHKVCQTDLDWIINWLIAKTHPNNRRDAPANMAQILSALKSAGANISKQSINLWTAAGHHEPFALKELLSDNITQEEMYNKKKQSLLHESARCGSLKCLQFLLESPRTSCLYVNALDYKKQSPLHMAVEGNHFRVAEFLLQHGADPDGGVGLYGRSDVTHPRESSDAEDGKDATRSVLHESHVVCEGTTPLHLAARHHRLSLMELLIRYKARTDVLNESQRTPLHEYANPEIELTSDAEEESLRLRVESLIVEKTQNINHQDKDGATLLHIAAQNGLLSLVETLVDHKARTDVKDKQQRTALHALASSTDNSWETKAQKKTTACLVAATDDINQGDQEGMTPLNVAAEHDNLSMMEVLIEAGARLDAVDRHKRSVLHAYLDRPCYCKVRLNEQRRRVEEALLANMPDLDSVDVEGRTAMHAAARCGHVSLIEKLMQRKCRMGVQDATGKTPLHYYAMSESLGLFRNKRWSSITQRMEELLIKAAVEEGSEINIQVNSRQSVLHMAASRHHWTLVESLIQHGARVDVLDENGQTPVHCYAENEYNLDLTTDDNIMERVENLLVNNLSEAGIINHQDKNGYSVLHLACGKGHWTLAESLLQQGARVDLLDRYSRTPLHWYAKKEYFELPEAEQNLQVEELLVQKMSMEGEVDINTQDTQGRTILHVAARTDNLSLMKLLRERHVRCDLMDQNNMSALHCYSLSWNRLLQEERAVEWLVEGSDVTAKAKCGCTPLDMAIQWDRDTFLVRALKSRNAPLTKHNADEMSCRKNILCFYMCDVELPELEMEPVSQTKWSASLKYPQAVTVHCGNCVISIQRLRGQREDHGASSAGHD